MVFVEGDRDLKFFTRVMSGFKQFSQDPYNLIETIRIRNFVKTDNFKTLKKT